MEFSTDVACLLGGVAPLELTITDRVGVVAGSPNVVNRGIAVTFGPAENSQPFAMMPSINRNNTIVPSHDRCKDGGLGCIAEAGGVFEYVSNEGVRTYNSADSWNGTHGRDIEGTDATSYAYFNGPADVEGTTIYGLPWTTVTNYSDYSQASLGLATNSSFLNASLLNGAIPSKQFSYWPGRVRTAVDYAVDGLLVIGGYDTNRVAIDSEFHSYALADTSRGYYRYRESLEITGLQWEYPKGNLTSWMPDGQDSQFAVLASTYNLMDLPYTAYSKFGIANNGTFNSTTYSYDYDYSKLWSYDYGGQLVVTLRDGFQVNVSAVDLFDLTGKSKSDTRYDPSTGVANAYSNGYNWSDNVGDFRYGTYDDPLYFGLPFLTSVLFVADYDRDVFYLANAAVDNRPITVKPLCTGGPATLNPSINATALNKTTTEDHHKKGVNAAAIGGGVGGGVCGLLIIGLIAFFLIRRRKKQRQQKSAQHAPFLPDTTEQPNRGSTISPPPKYASAHIYDANGNPNPGYDQRYGSPPPQVMGPKPELASPEPERPNRGTNSHWSTTNPGSSTTGTDPHGSSQHEMSSEHRMAATSGPFEMPNHYDYRE